MEEVLSVQMERRGLTGVIALKGLPSTCKTELALRIGSWAKCPVLCIQDFLGGGGGGADYYSGVDAADFTPPTTTDQVHRHHRNAFTALLNVAHRHLSNAVSNCVVIKSSSPNTPSELLQLLQLGAKFVDFRVIIIECKIKNNYLWKLRFDMFSDRYTESKSWSRPRSWKDIHKIMDDDDDDHPPSSDLNHLHELLRGLMIKAEVPFDYAHISKHRKSERESGTAMEEVVSLLMKQRGLKGVIALKGLPSTCKTELALSIGRRTNCPVLCIQNLLGGGGGKADYFEGAEADFSPPATTDDVERHRRKAFTSLLNVAHCHLSNGPFNFVVIKSSLNTQYELQQLLQLRYELGDFRVIILECKIRNKFLWRSRFEEFFDDYKESRSWYRPRSWKDIHKDVDDDDDWDLNLLHHLLKHSGDDDDDDDDLYVAWLQVDPFYDLFLSPYYTSNAPLPDEFNDAIKYLLTAPKLKLPAQNPYVADYHELRRSLFDQKLRAAARKRRSQSFCKGDCVFRYWQQVPQDGEAGLCGVCLCQISRQSAYTCHFCVATLHKTCAERFPIKALQSSINDYYYYFCYGQKSVQHPCKACQEGGKEFSKECRSCLFQDRLKCHLLPTILNHISHQHFLSMQLHNSFFRCKACGGVSDYGLGCKRCAFYCHTDCAFLPLEVKHEHGGHEHVMKLTYTRDAMDDEEDPCWCDCCYEDMDPELWFYSCQDCPHYVVHLFCSDAKDLRLDDPKMVKFIEQLQSQLDDLHTAGNSIKPC